MYYVISNSDGDTCVHPCVTEAEVLDLLPVHEESGYLRKGAFGSEDVLIHDTNYWNGRFLIIKGEVVTPELKTVAYELR